MNTLRQTVDPGRERWLYIHTSSTVSPSLPKTIWDFFGATLEVNWIETWTTGQVNMESPNIYQAVYRAIAYVLSMLLCVVENIRKRLSSDRQVLVDPISSIC